MNAHDEWFVVKDLGDGIHLLAEPPHVNSFLITGTKRAVLFDTGLGVANIRKVAEQITDLDILVVNSHYHFDHSGGNHLFSEIAIHELGASALAEVVPAEWLTMYIDYTARMLDKFRIYRELDDAFFHLLDLDMFPRPLPSGFDPKTWKTVPTVPSKLLTDGDVLDLGSRSLQVIHTPGHTPDCICLLDAKTGALFAGDMLCTGPHYVHLPDSDPLASARSARRLATEFRKSTNVIYPCHILRYAVDPGLLEEVASGFEAMVEQRAERTKGTDIFGDSTDEYRFNRFSIFVPVGWSPAASAPKASADAAQTPE
jgi:glyoxylase-like metal-dependent hydrolase (beta-lactamase superfamily II)